MVQALWRAAGAVPSTTDDLPALEHLVSEHGDLFLVAAEDNRPVGTIVGGWDGWRGNIYRLAVLPSHRRRGLARALVAEVARRLAARGARRITVLVEGHDTRAVAFWESLGELGCERDPRMMRYVLTPRPNPAGRPLERSHP